MLLRLIGQWLHAGVLEDGCLTHPETGDPQGGVISPMLSNVFLHYVLDQWFASAVQPRMKGKSFLIRYADDFVMGFSGRVGPLIARARDRQMFIMLSSVMW